MGFLQEDNELFLSISRTVPTFSIVFFGTVPIFSTGSLCFSDGGMCEEKSETKIPNPLRMQRICKYMTVFRPLFWGGGQRVVLQTELKPVGHFFPNLPINVPLSLITSTYVLQLPPCGMASLCIFLTT